MKIGVFFFFNFWSFHAACGILILWPGNKPTPLQLKQGFLFLLFKMFIVNICSVEITVVVCFSTLILDDYLICYFLKFIFNWRIIALQYGVGFCQTPTWISHRYMSPPSWTSIPPPTSSHPSRLLLSPSLSHTANSHWEAWILTHWMEVRW